MARKVFISILGTGFYGKCSYISNSFKSTNTRFAQQAILELCNAKAWSEEDKALIFLTESARKVNWDVKERLFQQREMVNYKGLKHVIEEMKLPIEIVDTFIPDGKNEKEMWEIFTTIYNILEDGDEVYIDLTHSFRYLPMLLLVLSNYAKFLKNIKIKHLSYGNYEARNTNTNEAPITNLLPITILQDWTYAAADYLENGNAERLVNLSKTELDPVLRESKGSDKKALTIHRMMSKLQETTEDFQTCRGFDIINAKNINPLKSQLDEVKSTFIKPLNPVIEKISDAFEVFDKNSNIHNGFHAAKWCLNNGLYQQSATILLENITSYFCERHGIKINDEDEREIINSAFYIITYKLTDNEDKWKVKKEIYKNKIRSIIKDPLLSDKTVLDSFSRLTELRNDINHAGMRSKQQPLAAKRIKTKLQDELKIITSKLSFNANQPH